MDRAFPLVARNPAFPTDRGAKTQKIENLSTLFFLK
jgi:hypothetical protein